MARATVLETAKRIDHLQIMILEGEPNTPYLPFVDAFGGGKSTYGTTELIVMNWLDSAITDPATVVIGSA